MQAFSVARSQTALPTAYRTGRARPAGRHAPPDRPMRSPCRPPRQVAVRHSRPCGSYSPHRCWPFLAGRPCRPSWPARPAWQLPARTAEPGRWLDTRRRPGHRLGGQRCRRRCCCPVRRRAARGPRRAGPAGLPDAGRVAVRPLEGPRQYDECPFAPGWRARSSCAWPNRPAGDNPTAAATTSDGRAGLYIDGRRGNQPASSHGRRYAQPDREQPGLTRRYPR